MTDTPHDIAPRRALAGLDERADLWAGDVSLSDMVSAIAEKDDRESRIEALARQAFIEGYYRAYIVGVPSARTVTVTEDEITAKFDEEFGWHLSHRMMAHAVLALIAEKVKP